MDAKKAEKKAAIEAMQQKIAELEQQSQKPASSLQLKMEEMRVQFRAKCRDEVDP